MYLRKTSGDGSDEDGSEDVREFDHEHDRERGREHDREHGDEGLLMRLCGFLLEFRPLLRIFGNDMKKELWFE